jgi:hypothetical protein
MVLPSKPSSLDASGERRALSSMLQNVLDAWMNYLGQPLPPISQY